MGDHIAKDWVYIDKAKVYVSDGTGNVTDERHLNANRYPNDVNAPTDFAYLTTDGSNDGPYLKSN